MKQEEFFSRYKYDRTKDLKGGGGFGNVYKVFDTIENEIVALKIDAMVLCCSMDEKK